MADRAGADDDRQSSGPTALDVATLVALHHAAVYRYACRLCGCPTEAEDLAQQTFLIAQRKLHQIREPARACSLRSVMTRKSACTRSMNRAAHPFLTRHFILLFRGRRSSTSVIWTPWCRSCAE